MRVAFSNTVGLFIEMVLGGLSVKGQCKLHVWSLL